MGDHGSGYQRFRRSVATGNPLLIITAAHEVARLDLADALIVLNAMAAIGDGKYERAAAKWTARAILECRLDLADARRVLALVEALPRTPAVLDELQRVVDGAHVPAS